MQCVVLLGRQVAGHAAASVFLNLTLPLPVQLQQQYTNMRECGSCIHPATSPSDVFLRVVMTGIPSRANESPVHTGNLNCFRDLSKPLLRNVAGTR